VEGEEEVEQMLLEQELLGLELQLVWLHQGQAVS